MVITKALALWLFIVGVIWAFVAAWINLVMSGISAHRSFLTGCS